MTKLVEVRVIVAVTDAPTDNRALVKAQDFVRYALATVQPKTLSNGVVIGALDAQGAAHGYVTDATAMGIVTIPA